MTINRYHRNILIEGFGEEGQKKLQRAKVLVVGAGGLGSPVLLYLAAAGVGTLGIIDFDKVDETNLQRQIIHFTEDIGKSKVQSAAEKISMLNTEVKINAYQELFTEGNARELVRQYDFVIDCCDNYTTKFLINDICEAEKIAFSHGAVLAMKGEVMTCTPGNTTYRSVFGAPPPEDSMPTAAEAGILGAIAGIIGSIQAAEAVKYITGIGELIVNRMLIFDGRKMQFYSLDCKAMSQSFQTTS